MTFPQVLRQSNEELAFNRRIVLSKLRRSIKSAQAWNALDAPVMATPPTVTTPTSVPGGLPQIISPVTNPGAFTMYGGVPTLFAGIAIQPVTTTNNNSGSVGALCGCWEIITDEPLIAYGFTQSTTIARMTVETQGIGKEQYVSKTPTTSTNTGTTYIVLDFGGVRTWKRIRMYTNSPLRQVYISAIGRLGAGGLDDDVFSFTDGDSVTVGTGSSSSDNSYVQCRDKLLGFRNSWQCGIGGTGWLNPGTLWNLRAHINDLIGLNKVPDHIGFRMGTNDTTYSAAALSAEILTVLNMVRPVFPNAAITVGGVWPLSSGPDSGHIATENTIASAVAQFNDSMCKFFPVCTDPAGPWIFGTGNTVSPTGVGNADIYNSGGATIGHPNDLGHEWIARRESDGIRRAIFSMTP